MNLGNSSPVDLATLIQTIENVLGQKARIEWLPEQPGDVPVTYADVSRGASHAWVFASDEAGRRHPAIRRLVLRRWREHYSGLA